MPEQSQDPSASPPEGAESKSANRPHLSAPLHQRQGAEKVGGRSGGAEKSSAPRGPIRPLVMVRLAAGASVKAVARDLGVHKSTVQFHRDGLVAAGAIKQVRKDLYARGPAYPINLSGGGADSDRPPLATATAPWLATDGSRTFEVLAGVPPQNVSKLAGFVGTRLTGRSSDPARKRRDHRIVWTHDGRAFDMMLMESPTAVGHGWSLQLKKVRPAPYLSAIAEPGEDKEAAWDRFTLNAVQAWAAIPPGVAVCPNKSRIRRSRPVSLALGGVLDPEVKFRSQDADADATPSEGTLEVRTAQLKAFVETGPEQQAAMGQALQEVSLWRSQVNAELSDVRAVSRDVLEVLRTHTEALVAIARSEAATLPPLSRRSLSPDSGVDVS